MSRSISATNLTEVDADHLHEVVLVKLEFGTPVYCHSGIGTINYGGNDYLGVGQFGSITDAAESEQLSPSSLTLQLSGVDSSLITEALDSGSYGDIVTIYIGYRQDDGTLVDDPWVLWRGIFEYSSITQGQENVVSITVQHDLATLNQTSGARFSDEDQQRRFSGDVGFEFVADMAGVDLRWGGGPVGVSDPRPGTAPPGVQPRRNIP